MSSLQTIRDLVRGQTDLDEEDLPDDRLDAYIKDSFDRTFAIEERWPFFQATWTLTKAGDATTIDLPTVDPLISAIESFRDSQNYQLSNVAQGTAEDMYQGPQSTTTQPRFWSLWGDVISLWPTPDAAAMSFTVRGYRKPIWTGVAADELDGDKRLHQPILWHAIALVYAQLEDPEVEADYMQRWGASLAQLQKDIMRPQNADPLILHGGIRPSPRPSLVFNLP